jgi:chloramphenicol-sensitive protein RarD
LVSSSIWGFSPVYFKLLGFADAIEIVAHRVVWSVAILALVIAVSRQGARLAALGWRQLRWLAVSGLLIAGNWGVFIWALQHGRLVETSLGYFINPLVSVVLGALLLGEWLRAMQWLALVLAAVGVLNEIVSVGVVPWLGLALAFSFGFYGLVRKQLDVGSVAGLAIETLLMLPIAVGYLFLSATAGAATPGADQAARTDWHELLLLSFSGVVTVVPLVCFAAAAQRLRLGTLGLFQYVSPTITFLLAILVYGEPFRRAQFVTFGCIWAALAIFSLEALYHQRRLGR